MLELSGIGVRLPHQKGFGYTTNFTNQPKLSRDTILSFSGWQ